MDVRRPKGRRIPGCAGIRRTLRALGRLARARRRIEHVPTRMLVRAMAHFDGRESSSYLLDPTVNYVPICRPARSRCYGRAPHGCRVTYLPAAGPDLTRIAVRRER